jgi:hypothetical protein
VDHYSPAYVQKQLGTGLSRSRWTSTGVGSRGKVRRTRPQLCGDRRQNRGAPRHWLCRGRNGSAKFDPMDRAEIIEEMVLFSSGSVKIRPNRQEKRRNSLELRLNYNMVPKAGFEPARVFPTTPSRWRVYQVPPLRHVGAHLLWGAGGVGAVGWAGAG